MNFITITDSGDMGVLYLRRLDIGEFREFNKRIYN